MFCVLFLITINCFTAPGCNFKQYGIIIKAWWLGLYQQYRLCFINISQHVVTCQPGSYQFTWHPSLLSSRETLSSSCEWEWSLSIMRSRGWEVPGERSSPSCRLWAVSTGIVLNWLRWGERRDDCVWSAVPSPGEVGLSHLATHLGSGKVNDLKS